MWDLFARRGVMENSHTRMRWWVFAMLVLMGNLAQAETSMLSVKFDELFPCNAVASALNTCMQAYGNLEQLGQQYSDLEDRVFLTDLAAGRLVRLQEAVEQLVGDKKITASEDVEYLLRVMHDMQKKIHSLIKTQTLKSKNKLGSLLKVAQKKLEQWVNQK